MEFVCVLVAHLPAGFATLAGSPGLDIGQHIHNLFIQLKRDGNALVAALLWLHGCLFALVVNQNQMLIQHEHMSLLSRLNERRKQAVVTSSGCILWPAYRDKDGYGQIRDDSGKLIRAHQASYLVFKGQYAGMVVMHTCDNPPCFNPEHLILGTYSDNLKDCWDKGRR